MNKYRMVSVSIFEEELNINIEQFRNQEYSVRQDYVLAMLRMMLHMVVRYRYIMLQEDVDRLYRVMLEITKAQ